MHTFSPKRIRTEVCQILTVYKLQLYLFDIQRVKHSCVNVHALNYTLLQYFLSEEKNPSRLYLTLHRKL